MPHIAFFSRKASPHLFLAMLILTILFGSDSYLSLASAQEANLGRFKTNHGPLILYEGKDKRIAGFFYYKGLPAHLFLSREDGGSYKGIWIQAISEHTCSTKKNGSPYWGTINAAFKDGKFLALWNYCDSALVNQENRQWKGTLQ